MLIEQIIEFEWRVFGPLVVHIFLKLVFFMKKQKSSKANLRVHYLTQKMLQKAMYFDFPDLRQVTKFNPKMQDFKRVLDLTWSKGNDFFNWVSNIKNFVCSNGFENVQNVIQIALKLSFFFKKLQKISQRLGATPPCPLCDMFELH